MLGSQRSVARKTTVQGFFFKVTLHIDYIGMDRTCCGVTRSGRPCTLTSRSTLKNERGRDVAAPLRRGGDRCFFHARPFNSCPVIDFSGPLVILFIDLETSGTDAANDRILELSAVQSVPVVGAGASFSTIVRVDSEILSTPHAQQAAQVHGIPMDEIEASPFFPECWRRFLMFVDSLLNEATRFEEYDTSDDELLSSPCPSEEPPTLLLAAHNGFSFDFAMLLFECERHGLDLFVFERWLFVDTLHVLRAAKHDESGGCFKLQCLEKNLCGMSGLQAHRGRDDCIALMRVIHIVAARWGLSDDMLMRFFTHRICLGESIAQVRVLLDMD